MTASDLDEAPLAPAVDLTATGPADGPVTPPRPAPPPTVLLLPEVAVPQRRPPSASALVATASGARRIVAGLTALALAFRLALVNAQSIWLDEALTARQAQMPLIEMWHFQLTQNVHVPLYHTFMHVWVALFGTGALALRVPSVLFGTAAVPLLYLVARRLLADVRAGLVAAAIASVAPFWVWHSDEARMYPLMVLLGLTSLLALFRAHDRGGAAAWLLYALVTGASFYSHYFVVLMAPVHLLWIVLQQPARAKLAAWLGGIAGAGALLAPWLVALYVERLGAPGATEFSNNARDFLVERDPFSIAYAMITFVAVFVTGYHSAQTLTVISGALVGVWPLVALASATRREVLSRSHTRHVVFLLAWLSFLVVAGFLIDAVKPGAWFQKYFILASVPTLLLLAFVVSRFSRRLAPTLITPIVVLGAVAVSQNVEPDNPVRQDWSSAVGLLEVRRGPDDPIVLLPAFNIHPFNYYWQDRAPYAGVLSPRQPVRATIDYYLPDIVARHPGRTMWVVSIFDEGYDPDGEVRAHLHAAFPLVESHLFSSQLRVEGFQLPQRPAPPPAAEPNADKDGS